MCGPAADARVGSRREGTRCPPRVTPRNFSWTSCPRTRRRPRRRRRRRRAWTRWWRRGREGRETGTARRPFAKRDIVAGIFASPFKSASWKTAAGKAGRARSRTRRRATRRRLEHRLVAARRVRLAVFLLARRSWRQVRRDGRVNRVRLMTSLNSAFVFGSIFWRMGRAQTSIQDRLGLLQVSAINTAMAALMKTLTAFTSEKVVVDRERASGAYGVLPYLAAKLVAELPVGAFFPLAFGAVAYPMTGLHPTLDRFGTFCGVVVLESFTSARWDWRCRASRPAPRRRWRWDPR